MDGVHLRRVAKASRWLWRLGWAPVVLGGLAGCAAEPALELPPPPVGVIEVLEADLPERLLFVGQARAVQRVEVRVRVQGRIEKKLFQDGDLVTQGQALFEIDPRPYRADVLQARADVTKAAAQLEKAQADLERATELFENDSISRAEYDLARANQKVARAEVSVARARLETAQLDLGYTTVTSPLSGRVGSTSVDLGNLVNPSTQTPLVVVTRLDPVYVEFSADERTYLEARRRQPSAGASPQEKTFLSLLLADGSPYPYEGELVYTSPEVNRQTGTIDLRALFPNPRRLLRPGLFTRVVFQTRDHRPRLLVPQEALVRKQAGTFVFVLGDDDTVSERKIMTGEERAELIMVTDGLSAGDRIVVRGVQKIRDGLEVKPTEMDPLTLDGDPLIARPPERWEGELVVPTAVP